MQKIIIINLILILFCFKETYGNIQPIEDCNLIGGIEKIFKNPEKSKEIFLKCINAETKDEEQIRNKIFAKIYLAYLYSVNSKMISTNEFNKIMKDIIADIDKYNKRAENYSNSDFEDNDDMLPYYLINSDQIDFEYLAKIKNFSNDDVLYIIQYAVPFITTDMIQNNSKIFDYIGINYGISSLEMIQRQNIGIIYQEPYKYILKLNAVENFLESNEFKELRDSIQLDSFYMLNTQKYANIISTRNFYNKASIFPDRLDKMELNDEYMCQQLQNSENEFCIKDFIGLIKKNKKLCKKYLNAVNNIMDYYINIGINKNEAQKYAKDVLNALIWNKFYD